MIARESARTEDTIVVEVVIDAPRSVVWSALTDPRMLASWWGSPDTYRADQWTIDLRVGGKWQSRGTSNDGSTFGVDGEFLEISPIDRLLMTWLPSWDTTATTQIEYTLSDEANGTRLRMVHSGFAGHAASRDNHAYGWSRVLSWLGEFAERQAAAA